MTCQGYITLLPSNKQQHVACCAWIKQETRQRNSRMNEDRHVPSRYSRVAWKTTGGEKLRCYFLMMHSCSQLTWELGDIWYHRVKSTSKVLFAERVERRRIWFVIRCVVQDWKDIMLNSVHLRSLLHCKISEDSYDLLGMIHTYQQLRFQKGTQDEV